MQQSGTLKKRKRRNIAKVSGLGTIPYDEAEDNFDIRELYNPNFISKPNRTVINTGQDTRIRMSYLLQNETFGAAPSSARRVTRNPAFQSEPGKEGDALDDSEFPPQLPLTSKYQPKKDLSEIIKERPCFLDKTTMARLKQILLLGIYSGTFPWKWNPKTHQVDNWSPKMEYLWNIQWFVVTSQTALISVYQLYSFKSRLESDIKTYREVFMASFSIFWYFFAVFFNLNLFMYKDRMREYINTLFKFNRDFVEKYLIHLDDYVDGGRLVINLSIPSNTSQVFVSVSLFLVMPYQPWYLFSYIYPKPWYWLIPGAFHEFIVVGQVIANYILYQWIMVAHANSLEFWLKETHNHNDSGHTKDELRHPKGAIEVYRTLQILCQCFNDCMAPLAIPLLKAHILFGMIPCGYVTIRSLNHHMIDEFPGILTYPVCVIDCSFAGFTTMALGAEVFDLGCGFVDSWSRTRQKDFRRVLMSCPTLKMKVARFYFITISTTITFFKVISDYIIDCIITFPA